MKIDPEGRIVYGTDGMLRLAERYYPKDKLPGNFDYSCSCGDSISRDNISCEQLTFDLKNDNRKVIITASENGYYIELSEYGRFFRVHQEYITGCPLIEAEKQQMQDLSQVSNTALLELYDDSMTRLQRKDFVVMKDYHKASWFCAKLRDEILKRMGMRT